MSSVLEVKDLKKTFKTDFWRRPVEAVRGISFEVQRGEVFGLIGPNGAGKTTTIKSILGLITPTAGEISVLGHRGYPREVAARIGYLSENPYVYTHLKPMEFLDYCGRLLGLSYEERRRRSIEMLQRVGLSQSASRPMGKFSKGMLQRMGLAQALLGHPELLILDEPMSGLDPLGRREVQDIIEYEHTKGTTIIFTSHILSDVERLCDRIALIRNGLMQAYGTFAEIIEPENEQMDIVVACGSDETKISKIRAWSKAHAVKTKQRGNHLRLLIGYTDAQSFLKEAAALNIHVVSMQPERRSLQAMFGDSSELFENHRQNPTASPTPME